MTGRGFGLARWEPDVRPQVFLGWLHTVLFAIVFIIAWANIARFA